MKTQENNQLMRTESELKMNNDKLRRELESIKLEKDKLKATNLTLTKKYQESFNNLIQNNKALAEEVKDRAGAIEKMKEEVNKLMNDNKRLRRQYEELKRENASQWEENKRLKSLLRETQSILEQYKAENRILRPKANEANDHIRFNKILEENKRLREKDNEYTLHEDNKKKKEEYKGNQVKIPILANSEPKNLPTIKEVDETPRFQNEVEEFAESEDIGVVTFGKLPTH